MDRKLTLFAKFTTMLFRLMRFLVRYRTLFCCVLITWSVGIIFGTLFLTLKDSPTLSDAERISLDIRELLQKRTLFDLRNPKVVRVLQYCSPLLLEGPHHEGVGVPGSQLEAVVVMMRHGDRGPLLEFSNLTSINCSVNRKSSPDFNKFISYADSQRDLRSMRDAFRKFDVAPRSNSCLISQLTEWGALQQLKTGQLLQKAYRDTGIFKTWIPQNLIVTSTFYERTYQSAVAFLYGLLPKFDIISTNIKPGLGSTLCYSQRYCNCLLAEKLRTVVEQEKLEHLNSHPAVQSLVDQLNAILQARDYLYNGATVSPDTVFDQLLVYICHQTSLPCKNEKACITIDQLSNVVSYLEWRGRQLAESSNVKMLSRLSMQGLLTDILYKLEAVRSSKKKHKLIFYSAHDKTLMPILLSLGIYDGIRPPYSSRLVLELYSRPESGNTTIRLYHLKILYNGKDLTKHVSFCSPQRHTTEKKKDYGTMEDNHSGKFCPLDNFAYFVNKSYLVEMNVANFQQACLLNT